MENGIRHFENLRIFKCLAYPGYAIFTTLIEATCRDVPIIIGGEQIRTEDVRYQVSPYNHQQKIAKYYWADKALVKKAADAAVAAQVCSIKIKNLASKSKFPPKIEILSKSKIWVENGNFRQKSSFWPKTKVMVENHNFGRKSKFCQKIQILFKNGNFGQK